MKVIYLSRSPEKSKAAFEAGVNIVITPNLGDMTRPDKTIYMLTGAGFVDNYPDAIRHGYIGGDRSPLKISPKEDKYPLAINSKLYLENFTNRIAYLRAHIKSPYGIYVGGSHNLIEHCIPYGRNIPDKDWSIGFEATHPKLPHISVPEYIASVWRDITVKMIEQALDTFYDVEEIYTGFKNPVFKTTKRSNSISSNGFEYYNTMARLKALYSNWRNIYFNCFGKENYTVDAELKLAKMKSQLQATGLSDCIYAGLSGPGSLTGSLIKESTICKQAAGCGGGFLSYMTNCRAGVLIDADSFTPLMKHKISIIKKYPVIQNNLDGLNLGSII